MNNGVILFSSDALQNYESMLKSLSDQLDHVLSSVSGINLNSVSGGDVRVSGGAPRLASGVCSISCSTVSSTIQSYRSALAAYSAHADDLAHSVATVRSSFEECEKNVISLVSNANMPQDGAAADASGSSEGSWLDRLHKIIADIAKKILGEIGPIGSYLSALIKIITAQCGFDIWEGTLDVGLSIVELVNGSLAVGKWALDSSKSLADVLFGFKGVADKAGSSGASSGALSDAIPLLKAGIKAIIENCKELADGKISVDRAVVEMIVETVGNVSISAANSAVASFIIGEIGVTGAGALIGKKVIKHTLTTSIDGLWQLIAGSDVGLSETMGHRVGDAYDSIKSEVMSFCADPGEYINNAVNNAVNNAGQNAIDVFNKIVSSPLGILSLL